MNASDVDALRLGERAANSELQHLGVAADGGERRPELMADRGDEPILDVLLLLELRRAFGDEHLELLGMLAPRTVAAYSARLVDEQPPQLDHSAVHVATRGDRRLD